MNTLTPSSADAWKPCDLRGSFPDAVSPELFADVGSAVGTLLAPDARVLVSGDFRLSTLPLLEALCDGLLRSGVHVLDAGQGPTPLAYFTARQMRADAMLMVTASHNPAEHNGLKLMLGSVPTDPDQLSEIRRLTDSRSFRSGQGERRLVDSRSEYSATLVRRWRRKRPTTLREVVVDAGNGAWSHLAPEILHQLGYRVHCLSCVPDGRFPDRPPDCALPANLGRLCNATLAHRPAIGIAWDGDGDRVAFVDEEGLCVSHDEIALLFSLATIEALREEPNCSAHRKMVVDIKCSEVVSRLISERGATPLPVRTGHAFMRSRMVAEQALLGLDACGHYFFAELDGGDDGLFAALFLLDILENSGVTLAHLRRSLPHIFSPAEIRIPTQVLSYHEALGALNAAFPHAQRSSIDGLRLLLHDGVVLLRESGTEAVVSLRVEGFTAQAYEQLIEVCSAALPKVAAPFLGLADRSVVRDPANTLHDPARKETL